MSRPDDVIFKGSIELEAMRVLGGRIPDGIPRPVVCPECGAQAAGLAQIDDGPVACVDCYEIWLLAEEEALG